MNKEIDRSELVRIVAEEIKVNPDTVDIFVDQLFKEVEKKMIDQSLVRLENLGIFRIIKSGKANRILFLGTTQKGEIKRKTNTSENKSVHKDTPETKNEETVPPVNSIEERPLHILESDDNKNAIAEEEIIVKPVVNKRIREERVPDENISSVKDEVRKVENRVDNRQRNVAAPYTPPSSVNNRGYRANNRYEIQNSRNVNSIFRKYKVWFGIGAALVIVVALLAMFVMPEKKKTAIANTEVQQVGIDYRFKELKNTDTQNISCIVVTEYNISLQQLSILYYGNEKFWPYLYKANENIVVDNYTIPSQSIIKIPKITVDLVELNTGKLNDKLSSLANDIAMKSVR